MSVRVLTLLALSDYLSNAWVESCSALPHPFLSDDHGSSLWLFCGSLKAHSFLPEIRMMKIDILQRNQMAAINEQTI